MSEYTDDQILEMIGREPVHRDMDKLKSFYENKTVMVTGAAGSIGSELVRLLITLGVKQVLAFDWWENGIFFLEQSLQSELVTYFVGDVKTRRVEKILAKYKPQIIIQAAAYKHCPLMQDNSVDCFNNNVWGGLNMMETAVEYGCENFILVSTDKAVNPSSIMGATKRICEVLMQQRTGDTIFNAVRFGNVIQSNGSVVNTFMRQASQGEPLTVTDKNITRYFMTKKEAVELILLSATIARNGDIFLLDMGKPVKIIELAQSIIKALKSKSKIKITGLRKGEKMFEELTYNPQTMARTEEDKIFIVKNDPDGKEIEDAIRRAIPKTLNYELTEHEMFFMIRSLGYNVKR